MSQTPFRIQILVSPVNLVKVSLAKVVSPVRVDSLEAELLRCLVLSMTTMGGERCRKKSVSS
jgi:hypothetical protein